MTTPFTLAQTVVRFMAMSMAAVLTLLWADRAAAHETSPAVANVAVGPELLEMEIRLNAEALLARVDLSTYTDTNDAPEAAEYDRFRAMDGNALAAAFDAAWPELSQGITVTGAGPLSLNGGEVTDIGNPDLPRETTIFVAAPVDRGADGVTLVWAPEYGPLILRQARGDEVYAEYLDRGETSQLLPVTGVVSETAGEAFWRFLVAGFEHIIPLGIDHILFVLGLFFFALKWSPILWQVTAFTVAHTVTLALATLGVINIPDDWMWLVEALIALSITWVAIENILQPRLGWLRPAVVFAFGLLHGLGFASVLSDFGLSQGQFVVSLVAFNIGVELGQLTVILGAFLMIALGVGAARIARLDDPEEQMVRDLPEMYRANAIIGSLIIGAVGFYWFIERAFL